MISADRVQVRVCVRVRDGGAGLSHTHFLSLECATNVNTNHTYTHTRSGPPSVERVGSDGHNVPGHVPEEENVRREQIHLA